MEKNKLTMNRKPWKKGLYQVNIKIDGLLNEWLAKENLSPTAVFLQACKELGFKVPETEE